MQTPHAIVFSSGKSLSVAEAVKRNLKRHFLVDIWTDNFFDENNTQPLNTFLKKLLCFDLAVLILGDDDVQLGPGKSSRLYVPRDNVIFELGATMARMGTKKTFLLTPQEPEVKLPSYFKGLEPLTYTKRPDGNYLAGTRSACNKICRCIKSLEEDAFHSDLPAVGLAHGYFCNFVRPVYSALDESQRLRIPGFRTSWQPKHGFTLTVVIPDMFMNRERVDEFLVTGSGAAKLHVLIKDGRDVSVYALPMKNEDSRLHCLDIPTTLLTSDKVIKRVDHFWGGGDRDFKDALMRREILAFARCIRGLIKEEQLSTRRVYVVELRRLQEHITTLGQSSGSVPDS